MPSLPTLQAFAATVEANDHVGAIVKFYAPDAQTRENNNPPIAGRDVLAEKERRVLESVAGVTTTRLGPLFLDGDHTAICWRFEFTRKDGTKWAMEEMALQIWRGEQVLEERFFYDPKQMGR
jgi:ketosteroid isomerase-like protein